MTLHLACPCGRMWMDRPAGLAHVVMLAACPTCGGLLRLVAGPAQPLAAA